MFYIKEIRPQSLHQTLLQYLQRRVDWVETYLKIPIMQFLSGLYYVNFTRMWTNTFY